jgi:hypothetical protein
MKREEKPLKHTTQTLNNLLNKIPPVLRAIWTAKRYSWKAFISSTEDHKTTTLLSKISQNKLNRNTTNFSKKPDGALTTNSQETA